MHSHTHTFIVCLKGSPMALHQAYRRSLRMVAEFDKEFSDESAPGYVSFEWMEVAGYKVMAVASDGIAYNCDFNDVPGIEEAIYVMRNTDAMIAQSNDTEGKVLSHKEMFGIPEAEYEIIPD